MSTILDQFKTDFGQKAFSAELTRSSDFLLKAKWKLGIFFFPHCPEVAGPITGEAQSTFSLSHVWISYEVDIQGLWGKQKEQVLKYLFKKKKKVVNSAENLKWSSSK